MYLDFPLQDKHPRAFAAAVAAHCAAEQGRYDAMHRRLMRTSAWQQDGDWAREARAAAVPDSAAFGACLRGPAGSARVERAMALATAFGVASTPWFFTARGTSIAGVPPDGNLSRLF